MRVRSNNMQWIVIPMVNGGGGWIPLPVRSVSIFVGVPMPARSFYGIVSIAWLLVVIAGCSGSSETTDTHDSSSYPVSSQIANWIPTNVQLIDPILHVVVTDDGVVWAATTSFGLLRIRPDGVGWERLELPVDGFIRVLALTVAFDESGTLPTRILFGADGLGLYSLTPSTGTLDLLYEVDPKDVGILDISYDGESGEIIAVAAGLNIRFDPDSTALVTDTAGYTDVLHLAGSDRVLAIVRGRIPSIETPENIVRLIPGEEREGASEGFPATANELAQDSFDLETIYATSNDGLWVSRDEGRSWERSGLDGEHVWAIATSKSIPGLMAVSTRGPGVYVSRDSGETWSLLGLWPLRSFGWSNALSFATGYEDYLFIGTRTGSVFKQHLSEDQFALVSGSFPADSPRRMRENELAIPIDEPQIPVVFVFGDDGRVYFTNQGQPIQYVEDGQKKSFFSQDRDLYPVNNRAEDGLIGMDIVETDDGPYVYWYYGHAEIERPEVRYRHRVMRIPLDAPSPDNLEIILEDLPAGSNEGPLHVAGAVEQGPDGAIFVTIGDTDVPEDAQSIGSLRGSILRMLPDGSGYEDNPFPEQPLIWAYGFRNPFDLSWDKDGQLFAVDVGGGTVGIGNPMDEINIIEPGENYGWPVVTGPDREGRFKDPIWSFPSIGTPSGILVYSDESHPEYLDDIFVCEFNFRRVRWLKYEQHLGGLYTDMGWIADECITTIVQGEDGDIYYTSQEGIRKISLDE